MYARVVFPGTLDTMTNELAIPQARLIKNGPAMDILESEQAFSIIAEVPGFRKEEITINFENGVMNIQGSHKAEERPDSVRVRVSEINPRTFSRAFRFGSKVDGDRVEAKLDQGLLHITVPKAESAKPRTVAIQ